jgi:glycosyltransferase involved in cell wall biosynthesis
MDFFAVVVDEQQVGERLRVLLLSRYEDLGASSRHRSYQYLPYLRGLGHSIDVVPLLSNNYVQRLYTGRNAPVFEVMLSYLQRFIKLLQSGSYDLIWLEYEAFPWIPYRLESMFMNSSVPYIVDYDDAIFHRYDRHSSGLVRGLLKTKIDNVMKRATLVIAGNKYIAQHARDAGAQKVEVLPTAVDLDRFPVGALPHNKVFTIGWIGTPQTSQYLKETEEALQIVCDNGNGRLVTIGSTAIDCDGVPTEMKAWSEATEVEEMRKFDVGIMPLVDSPWERGKCGHKLIQYMACSLPVVASPVGVNRDIVDHGTNGFLASTTDEWVKALETLRHDRALREQLGRAGRQKVERLYSTSVTAPRLAALLHEASRELR